MTKPTDVVDSTQHTYTSTGRSCLLFHIFFGERTLTQQIVKGVGSPTLWRRKRLFEQYRLHEKRLLLVRSQRWMLMLRHAPALVMVPNAILRISGSHHVVGIALGLLSNDMTRGMYLCTYFNPPAILRLPLVQPGLWKEGGVTKSLAQAVLDALSEVDSDTKAQMLEGIVLVGGSARLEGLGDRLEEELKV